MLVVMDLIEAFLTGKVSNLGKPESHVETVMSDVFIYSDTVIKLYKERTGIFIDLKQISSRRNFYIDDFTWNQQISPTIHKNLYGIKKKADDTYLLSNPEEAENWVIEMKRIEATDTLFKRLHENVATTQDVTALTKKQTESLAKLTAIYKNHHLELLNQGLIYLWQIRLDNDLRQFGKSFGKEIAPTITDTRIDKLLSFFNNHPFLQNLNSNDVSIMIDNHAGNVVFYNNQPEFIDIFLPKREWRVLDHHNNIARIATCVRVLGSDDLANAMYQTYSDYKDLAPKAVYDFMEAYNALIKGYYYTYLKKPDIANKYFSFADKIIEWL